MVADGELITVEFFGIPRQRAGRAELVVRARTVGEVLAAVARACPALAGLTNPDGQLTGHYLLSLDGQRFVTDMREVLRPGERVLLLSPDVGG